MGKRKTAHTGGEEMSLDYVGFNRLRPGRIHMFCPGCGRKESNVPRSKIIPYDPPNAVLCHNYCERCSAGCKDTPVSYLDKDGKWLCDYCGRRRCELMGGTKRCDEGLTREAPDAD